MKKVLVSVTDDQLKAMQALGMKFEEIEPEVEEKPKPDPLVNLFDGAPVFGKQLKSSKWQPIFYANTIRGKYLVYYEHKFCNVTCIYVEDIKLPTIEESPRNTWLCATPELIDQCEGLDCLFWCSNGGFITRKHYEIKDETVQRFMILEK